MANPILNQNFGNETAVREIVADEVMTVNGTLGKTAVLGVILFLAAEYVWNQFSVGHTDNVNMLTTGGAIVGFILGVIISFFRTKFLIPIYAVAEGLCLGGISAITNSAYPGIVLQAVTGTIFALFSMLLLYRARVINCTDKFKSVIFISTASICGVYLVDLIVRFFGHSVPLINSNSNAGILISLFVVVIAALNLIIDFDFIEKASQRMIPKDYEWYGAFGLMVTLIWVYMEILRLLSKLRSRN